MASMLLNFLRASCQSVRVCNVLSRLHLLRICYTSRLPGARCDAQAVNIPGDFPCGPKYQRSTQHSFVAGSCTLHALHSLHPVYHVISVVTQWFRHHPNKRCSFFQGSSMILRNRSFLQLPGLLEVFQMATSISKYPEPQVRNPNTFSLSENQKSNPYPYPRLQGTEVVGYKSICLKPPWNGSGTESHPCIAMRKRNDPTNPMEGE